MKSVVSSSQDTNLYSLPKDMLVKIISTIREDTIKEYEEKVQELEDKLKFYKNVEILYCHEEGCDKKGAKGGDEIGDDYFYCNQCDEVFCESHIVYNGAYYCKTHEFP